MDFYRFSEILAETRLSSHIHQRDPVRNAVAGVESYWSKPGKALTATQETLHDYGYILPHASFTVHDRTPSYTQRFEVQKMVDPQDPNSGTEDTDSWLVFSWHWMPSGEQVEVTAYLS